MEQKMAEAKRVTKLYTGVGDEGYTGLLGRDRVPKYDIRPEAYGTVDEASSALGLARATVKDAQTAEIILGVQRDLYAMMADLATLPEAATRPPWLHPQSTECLESLIGRLESAVELPPAFIVAGDSVAGAHLDLARTIIRRAERIVARLHHDGKLRTEEPLRYLNRLSSLLFLLARLEDKAAGVDAFTLARLG
jgi:cob(I)alamin adenosyltransferase